MIAFPIIILGPWFQKWFSIMISQATNWLRDEQLLNRVERTKVGSRDVRFSGSYISTRQSAYAICKKSHELIVPIGRLEPQSGRVGRSEIKIRYLFCLYLGEFLLRCCILAW